MSSSIKVMSPPGAEIGGRSICSVVGSPPKVESGTRNRELRVLVMVLVLVVSSQPLKLLSSTTTLVLLPSLSRPLRLPLHGFLVSRYFSFPSAHLDNLNSASVAQFIPNIIISFVKPRSSLLLQIRHHGTQILRWRQLQDVSCFISRPPP